MKELRTFAFLLLPLSLFALSGCGGGSSGSGAVFGNPTTTSSSTTTTSGTPTGQTAPFSLEVATDTSTIDANNGTVLATATLRNASSETVTTTNPTTGETIISNAGASVPDQVVTFTILAGPATITATTPFTDVNGTAKSIITTQNTSSTTNVIIEARTTLLGITYRAFTSFKIIRGTGEISIPAPQNLPSAAPGMLPTLEATVNPVLASGYCWNQLIPFKLTDANAGARVGVPVTLTVYSNDNPTNCTVNVNYLTDPASEPSRSTVTTDSAGQGIYNVQICMNAPSAGLTDVCSVVYKSATNDTIPITAYVGQEYSLKTQLPTLTIAPSSASFGSSTTITLSIAGGVAPYNVTSSNPSRVTVVTSGTTVTATLVDTTTWTGAVTITVTDAAGQTASSSLTR